MNRLAGLAIAFLGIAAEAQAQFAITNTPTLPTGVVGLSYSFTHTAAGGGTAPTWSLETGSNPLPPGLSLSSSSGLLSGVPTTPGTFTFTVRASALSVLGAPVFDTQLETLTINPPLQITTPSPLPAGLVGQNYSRTFQAAGGLPPYVFSSESALPPGLSLSSATGTLSGIPTLAGTFNFSVCVTDSAPPPPIFLAVESLADTVCPAFQLTITNSLAITTASLSQAQPGVPYSQAVQATGGLTPYFWLVSAGALPAGLTLNSGSGVISGTTTAAPGSYPVTIQVVDASKFIVSRAYTLLVGAPLAITTASLNQAFPTVPYSQTLQATGGVTPYTWSGTGLPAGLTLSSAGVISGTTTAAPGNYPVNIQVADSVGQTASRAYTLTVGAALTIITESLNQAFPTVPYSQTLQAAGGLPPYSWSVIDSALPAGLTLNSATGVISGTTTAPPGNYPVTIRVMDSTEQTATRSYTLVVGTALTITTASLNQAFPAVPYSQTLQAAGGVAPYTWSATGLPAGLTLDSATGVISGTTTAPPGNYPVTIRVMDSTEQTATRSYTLTVGASLTILTPPSLPEIASGVPRSFTFQAAGGLPPYSWSILSGSPPAGMTFNSSGVLVGTPSTAGSFTFTLQVTDSAGATASRTFLGEVTAPPAPPLLITTGQLADVAVGSFVSYGFSAQGGRPPYTFSLTQGSAPDGMTFSGNQLRGIPTRAGTFRFTVEVTDSEGETASKDFSLTITQGLTITTESPLPDQFVGLPASLSVQAAGGRPPYAFSLTGGSLPAGLSMQSSGTITGTPTQAGDYSFVAQVRDQAGATVSKTLRGRVVGPPEITTESPLTGFVINQPSGVTLAATGGRPPYTWALTGGSLPGGLSLNGATGAITGTPPQAGRFSFTVQVTDANRQTASKTFTGEVAAGLTIVTESPLTTLFVGVAGGYSLSAVGGVAPYRWSASGLPAGLSLNSASGAVSGTPEAAAPYTLNVQVTDARNATATKTLSGQVLARLVITTDTLPGATLGTGISIQFAATGATGPITWSSSGGSLPPGTSLSQGGSLTGTPTQAGVFNFDVTATSGPQTAQRGFQITVQPASLSSVTIGGVPDSVPPGQQPRVTLTIDQPYPTDILGTVVLTFRPDAVVNADDPAVQFSGGGRTARFTLPAGSTQASFTPETIALQTGTVAGVITLTTTLQSGGQTIDCNCPLTREVRVPRTAPVITQVQVQRSGSGFTVLVTGYSSTREITQGAFRFTGGAGLQTSEVVVPLGQFFTQWFQSTPSQPFGGQFQLTMPFTIAGDSTAVTSVSVTLTNTVGTSQPSSATF